MFKFIFPGAAVLLLLPGAAAGGRWLIDDFEKAHSSWTAWADSRSVPAERSLVPVAAAGKQAMKVTFHNVANTAVIGRQGMRIPDGADALAFWIRLDSGSPQTTVTIQEEAKDGDTFIANIPVSQNWRRVVVPFETFVFHRGGGNRKLDRDKTVSLNFISYRNAVSGSFLVDEVEWVKAPPETAATVGGTGTARRNLLPGDTGFETGVGSWMLFHTDEPLSIATGDAAFGNGALPVAAGKSWICGGWVRDLRRPGVAYTLSFYAKGPAGRKLNVSLRTLAWKWLATRDITVGPTWTRYSLRVPAQNDVSSPAYVAFARPNGETDTILIDAVQFEEGTEATGYQPSEAVGMYGTTGCSGEIVTAGQRPVFRVEFFNADLAESRWPLRFFLAGPGGWSRSAEIVLKPGERTSLEYHCDFASVPGFYPLQLTLRDGSGNLLKEQQAPFVMAPEPDPVKAGEGFCGLHIDYTPQDAMRAIGVNWVRANTTHWHAVEPERGKFGPMGTRDFSKTGINWFATLLDVGTPPGWARGKDKLTADPRDFAGFVDYALARTGGEVAAYELQNEPDLTMPAASGLSAEACAKNYADLVNAIGPRILAAGNHLAVNGSGESGAFMREVFRLAGKSFDLYAPHTYPGYSRFIGPHAGYVIGPEAGRVREQLLAAAELIREHGADQQLWIGEIGYGVDVDAPFDSVWSHRHAAFLARTMIWARTVPELRRVMWFTGLGTFEQQRYEYGIWRNENGIRPLPAAAAYAAAAKRIDSGTDFKIHTTGDMKLVEWNCHGESVIAIWNASERIGALAFELSAVDADVVTLYGTPVSGAFLVEGAPFYIHPKPGKRDKVLAGLLDAVARRRPLDVTGNLADATRLRLRLCNPLDTLYRGRVSIPPAAVREFELGAREERVLELELPCAVPPEGAVLRPEFVSGSGDRFVPELPLPPMTLVTRRNLAADWRTFEFRMLPPTFQLRERDRIFPADPFIRWGGADDLSARVWLFWDERGFYLFAEVTDDVFNQPYRNGDIWRGDALQFAFDAANDALPENGYDHNDYEYGAACGGDGAGPTLWCWQAAAGMPFPGAAAKLAGEVRRDGENRVLYRIAIPWSELAPFAPKAGSVAGFNLVVTENDGSRANYHLELAPGLAPYKNPAFFRKLVLAPGTDPVGED